MSPEKRHSQLNNKYAELKRIFIKYRSCFNVFDWMKIKEITGLTEEDLFNKQ